MQGVALRRECHRLCAISYRDDVEIHEFGDIEVYCLVRNDLHTCFLAFRGSDERSDWFRNFHFWPVRDRLGVFHRGYYRSIQRHRHAIAGLIPAGYKLVCTGHSKGGAEAVLFGLFNSANLPVAVVTFGAPKPIKKLKNNILEKWLRNATTHYVNPLDSVTKVPFGWVRIGKDVIKRVRKKGSEHPLSVYAEFFKEV